MINFDHEPDAPAWVSECIRRIGMIELMKKQLRCKDCWWFLRGLFRLVCLHLDRYGLKVNPGQFACKKFVYKDK